ncbi:MAG TPA: SHOCT domain-containing protein [Candidatus Limnocylindrales bacterium]|nr:SHOCT domain-containing protein [Candidatus Limnocylindrales bacterium]
MSVVGGIGFGIVALIWLVVIVAFWALVIVGVVFAVRWLIRADRNSRLPPGPPAPSGPRDDPLEILRQRYARGEIDEEEFERRRRTLTGG